MADAGAGGGVDALAEDLELAERQGPALVLAAPHHQELVGRVVVGDGVAEDVVVGRSVRTHVGDAEVVGAGGCPGRREELAEHLPVVVDQRAAIVVADPGDEVVTAAGRVCHARGDNFELGVARAARIGDAEVVGAAGGEVDGAQALPEHLRLARHQAAGVVDPAPHDEELVLARVVGDVREDG